MLSQIHAHKYVCIKIACCTNLQLPILFFVKLIISDMHHRLTCMYINFQQNRVNRSVKPGAHKSIRKKITSCINLQLPIVIFNKLIISNIRHRKSYMYINLQQNRVNRSVITVHTKLFAKNRKLHKFATTNSIFF